MLPEGSSAQLPGCSDTPKLAPLQGAAGTRWWDQDQPLQRLLSFIITDPRHPLPQISMEPAAPNYHPPQDICPPRLSSSAQPSTPFSSGQAPLAAWAAGPAGRRLEGYLTPAECGCLCHPEEAWGRWHLGAGPACWG